MELLDITVYYLEMRARPGRRIPPPRDQLSVEYIASPSIAYWRAFYNAVGEPYRWLSRRKMSDDQLSAIIHDERVEMHVLRVQGQDAGFAELDRRQFGEIELVQFGLLPEFVGQSLGKWFLQQVVEIAWGYEPQRFWLHTCSLDHQAALPNYLKAGFTLFKQELIRREY